MLKEHLIISREGVACIGKWFGYCGFLRKFGMGLIMLQNELNALEKIGIGKGYLKRRGNGKKRGGVENEN